MHQPDDFNPTPGLAEELAPGVRRILCNNPSAFTYRGTNTYLVGRGAGIAVIDPGPHDPAHLQAILDALKPGEAISHIFVTHAHADHSPLASDLAKATGAPILAYGPVTAGQSPVMQALAAQGGMGGGEGADPEFQPDVTLSDLEVVEGDGWRMQAVWTPGHLCNHMSFDLAFDGDDFGTVFCADHVMGWSTSIVSPPEGDLTQFMQSCDVLLSRPARTYYPGHGAPLEDPHARLRWLVAHRKEREAGILTALKVGPADARGLADRVYTDIQPQLLPAAARNVFAHLIDLTSKNVVAHDGDLTFSTTFQLV
ncbi:MBL fold metallo-hydrolase [Pseudooceanicola sp. MF1-13]|uniref:MBL fold metallo-hydrolase n=1 Tax=Pseudooceanicola sp. MF1-13 TaxID=3379095 RepID=UPI003891E7B3